MSPRSDAWKRHLERVARACERLGADVQPVEFSEPASRSQVEEIEQQLGRRLPPTLRRLFTEHAARLGFAWRCPEGHPIPGLPSLFRGQLRIALEDLPRLAADHADWVRTCFPDPQDPYDVVWHDAFPILSVDNGDYFAIDTARDHDRIVYLSHDDDEAHGATLAHDVLDLLDRYTALGCAGPEAWQWRPFHEQDGLNPSGEHARTLHTWLDHTAQESRHG